MGREGVEISIMKETSIDFYFGLTLFFTGYFLSNTITLATLFFFVDEIQIVMITGILFSIMGVLIGGSSLVYFLNNFKIVRRD